MLRMLIPGLIVIVLSAALASAAPILDGVIGTGEYTVSVQDTYVSTDPAVLDETGMEYFNTGLDIDYVHFDANTAKLYLGISTKDTFSRNGAPPPAASIGKTGLSMQFYTTMPDLTASSPTEPLWSATMTLNATEVEQARLVQNLPSDPNVAIDLLSGLIKDGSGYSLDTGIPDKFDYSVGESLEITLDMSLMVVDPSTAPFLVMQLDDVGDWRDDQLIDVIPEPATMGLLAIGAVLLLRRRRVV